MATALLVGLFVTAGPAATENAAANGDTRTLTLYHSHTHETLTTTFKRDGSYVDSELEKLNWALRDWRRDEPTKMDPHLFDIVWEVYREIGSGEPITVVSAYRSPETNAMLRRRSRAVAKHSQHMLGKAMDLHLGDVSMAKVREIGMRLQKGGVGYYPTAGTPFVHLDAGNVRHWPKMSYEQLSRLFPDGKTVHIPSNGQPLARYEEARAEIEARGGGVYPSVASAGGKGFFARLFGGGDDEDEGDVAIRSSGNGRRIASIVRGGNDRQLVVASTSNDGGSRTFFTQQTPQQTQQQAQESQPEPIARAQRNLPRGETALRPGPAPTSKPSPEEAVVVAVASAEQRVADQQRPQSGAKPQVLATIEPQKAADATAASASAQVASASAQVASASAQVASASAQVASTLDQAAAKIALMPVPPKRPTDLAYGDPGVTAAPVPPARPVEFASASGALPELAQSGLSSVALASPPKPPLSIPDVPALGTKSTDPIGAMIAKSTTQSAINRAANIPVVITRGTNAPKPVEASLALAYAASLAEVAAPVSATPRMVTPVRAAPGARNPLPVAKSDLVPARLDRSNFRSLTGAAATIRTTSQSVLGTAVPALRPAAHADIGAFTAGPSAGITVAFGEIASDLSTDQFSGPAVRPLPRIVEFSNFDTGSISRAGLN